MGTQRVQNALFGLRAKAMQALNIAVLGGLLQRRHVLDMQPAIQGADPLGTESGYFEQFGDRGQKLFCRRSSSAQLPVSAISWILRLRSSPMPAIFGSGCPFCNNAATSWPHAARTCVALW